MGDVSQIDGDMYMRRYRWYDTYIHTTVTDDEQQCQSIVDIPIPGKTREARPRGGAVWLGCVGALDQADESLASRPFLIAAQIRENGGQRCCVP